MEAEKKVMLEEIEWARERLRLVDGKVGGTGAAASGVPQLVTMCVGFGFCDTLFHKYTHFLFLYV